jgi:hypothetical protein
MLAMPRPPVAVVLIDISAPGYPKPTVSRYWKYLPTAVRAVFRGEGRQLATELVEHFQFLRAKRNSKRALNSQPAPSSGIEKAEGGGTSIADGLTPGGIAMREYMPRPFPGLLANVLAGDRQVSERIIEDPRRGWRDFARRGFYRESSISGTHHTIFDSANAPSLASSIRSAIQLSAQRP